MDPNANLEELRALVEELNGDYEEELAGDARARALERVAELVEALDVWIIGGGALPDAWRKGRA